jgi:hypothetical protein
MVAGAPCSHGFSGWAWELEAPASVIMTIYNPISENLIATEPGNGGEAKGNCVAARLGGKQPGAKEQSQTKVNSIRCRRLASLLANGEACAKHDGSPLHPPVRAERPNLQHGWSENVPKEVYVSGESCMSRHWGRLQAMQQSEPPYERRSRVMPMEQREVGK